MNTNEDIPALSDVCTWMSSTSCSKNQKVEYHPKDSMHADLDGVVKKKIFLHRDMRSSRPASQRLFAGSGESRKKDNLVLG